MAVNPRVPSYTDVLEDVREIREQGVGRLRTLDVPALWEAAQLADLASSDDAMPAAIVGLLRRAVDTLGGGTLQEAAEYSLGLVDGTALWSSKMRRDKAATIYGLVAESFRKKPERELLGQVAEAVLVQCHEGHLRRGRIEMENRRHPADSRLAVQWVERFEAYNRIWTPAYALAADLEAALDTYLEEPADHYPWDPNSAEPYDPIRQAQGYGHSALYWLAKFHLEVKRFVSKHGGMWLLTDPQVEEDVSDAVYRIGWHNSLSDGDEAFLRRHLADSRHEEPDHFWKVIQAFPDGLRINKLWQDMIHEGVGLDEEQQAKSQVHLAIKACRDYCRMIDEDWLKIADWYRPGTVPKRTVTGSSLYKELLSTDEA